MLGGYALNKASHVLAGSKLVARCSSRFALKATSLQVSDTEAALQAQIGRRNTSSLSFRSPRGIRDSPRGWLVPSGFTRRDRRLKVATPGRDTQRVSLSGPRFSSSLSGIDQQWQPAAAYADGSLLRESEIELGASRSKVQATLTLPKGEGRYACAILISGSLPCDQDSSNGAIKPLKDLAWGLAHNGIASLRFDKVTLPHSTAFEDSNITLSDEYMDHTLDAISKCNQHPEILRDTIFLLGHSLGAIVVPRVSAMEDAVTGCIIMAGPTTPLYHSAIRQMQYIASLEKPTNPELSKQIEELERQADLADSPDLTISTPAQNLPFGIGPAYWLDSRTYDPVETARRLEKPILVLQGGRDYQVTIKDDFEKWKSALGDMPHARLKIYDELNHLFISGDMPSTPAEYSILGNVHDQVVKDISVWISKVGRPRQWVKHRP